MKRVSGLDYEIKKQLKSEGMNRAQIRAEMKRLNKVYKKVVPIYEDAKKG